MLFETSRAMTQEPVFAQPLLERLRARLAETVPADLIPTFRRYFAVHVFLQVLKLHWHLPVDNFLYAVYAFMLAALALSFHRKLYPLGLLGLLVFKLQGVVTTFPMTDNHSYVESSILLFLLLFQNYPEDREARQVDGTPVHLIQMLVLSVYFFSGVHKLLHGYWLNAEFVGQALFAGEDRFGFWYSTQLLLQNLAAAFGLPLGHLPYDQSTALATSGFPVQKWVLFVLLALAWFTIFSEIMIPALVAYRKTRRVAIYVMLILSALVGLFSWETEFMFATLGSILLFLPGKHVRNYYVLLAIHVLWSVSIVAADIRIPIL